MAYTLYLVLYLSIDLTRIIVASETLANSGPLSNSEWGRLPIELYRPNLRCSTKRGVVPDDSSNQAVLVQRPTMSNPWRETRGYSFHSICLHVKDISLSSMFYQDVFGMDVVREANLGYVPEHGA